MFLLLFGDLENVVLLNPCFVLPSMNGHLPVGSHQNKC